MKKQRLAGVIVIGIFEILFGLIGCLYLGWALIDVIKTNGQIGFGWLSLPLITVWALMFPLGVAMILQKKIGWFAHIIFIPLIMLVILVAWMGVRLDVRIVISIPLILCAITLYYITRSKVKEQFK